MADGNEVVDVTAGLGRREPSSRSRTSRRQPAEGAANGGQSECRSELILALAKSVYLSRNPTQRQTDQAGGRSASPILMECLDRKGHFIRDHIIQIDGDWLIVRVFDLAVVTDDAKAAIESTVAVMQLVSRRTPFLAPEVYRMDATASNELGMPYIVLEHIEGLSFSEAWGDEGQDHSATRRERMLATYAHAMTELNSISCSAIGSVGSELSPEGTITDVGPSYLWIIQESSAGEEQLMVKTVSPCHSTLRYLQEVRAPGRDTKWKGGEDYMINQMIQILGDDDKKARGRFKYTLGWSEDNRSATIWGHDGSLKGIMDWTSVQSLPACLGYCRYPDFITEDWRPRSYDSVSWRKENEKGELARYRTLFARCIADSGSANGVRVRLTLGSDVLYTMYTAITDQWQRTPICVHFTKHAISLPESELSESSVGFVALECLERLSLPSIGCRGLREEARSGLRRLVQSKRQMVVRSRSHQGTGLSACGET